MIVIVKIVKINANRIPKLTAKINGHIDCCEKSVEPNIPRPEKCKNILLMTEDKKFVNTEISIICNYDFRFILSITHEMKNFMTYF